MEYFDFQDAAEAHRSALDTDMWDDYHEQSSQAFDEGITSSRRKAFRYPQEVSLVLKTWLMEHTAYPYPNGQQKEELRRKTGLTKAQISNWLSNARRRIQSKPPSRSGTSPVDIPRSKCSTMNQLDPLERWKRSPAADEPASMSDIARATSSSNLSALSVQDLLLGCPLRNVESAPCSENGSTSSLSSSIYSTCSTNLADCMHPSSSSYRKASCSPRGSAHGRRRRRRAILTQSTGPSTSLIRPRDAAQVYQCTFCTGSYATKYDWRRHEKSLHLTLERWICRPSGGIRESDSGERQQTQCTFCPELNPTNIHLDSHNLSRCQHRPLLERTFYRKDHLTQHLRLVHQAKFATHMETWRNTITHVTSRCGFCSIVFSTWRERAEHIAEHFRLGADMSQWSGTWGFEPHVEALVENGIPPHLIETERRSMNPFVAQAIELPYSEEVFGADNALLEEDMSAVGGIIYSNNLSDGNWWGKLGRQLSNFVVGKQAEGVLVTDEMLRSYARLVTYDDTDPWNWTSADDETWLSSFKTQHGLLY